MSEPTADVAPPTQVSLPDIPEIRGWIETTQAKRAALQVRADRLREQFDPLRQQLAAVERSIKVLDHFLNQVTITTGAAMPVRRPRGGPALLSGQWSRKHGACRGCGTADAPHKAQGYCKGCYDKHVARGAAVEAVS
jgi:hypothetical protein